ncbi:hypothetical protein D0Z03_000510 [Geotrichum reessii]|nr:hypothetical protein D0Z03_000510 [Galactomyces reessii]
MNESNRNYTHQQQQHQMYPQHHQSIQHQQQQSYPQHQQQQQHIQHHHNQQYIQHQQPQYSQYSQAPLLHHPAHYENSSIAYPYPQQLHHPQQQPNSSLPLSPASSPESRGIKPKRKRATADQINRLNQVFEQTFFPTSDQRMDLAQELGMTPRTVQIWFQNKRQGWRSEHRRPVPREPLDEHNRM